MLEENNDCVSMSKREGDGGGKVAMVLLYGKFSVFIFPVEIAELLRNADDSGNDNNDETGEEILVFCFALDNKSENVTEFGGNGVSLAVSTTSEFVVDKNNEGNIDCSVDVAAKWVKIGVEKLTLLG